MFPDRLLDKDYRSDTERSAIVDQCNGFCDFVTIYERKEIENFLLIPAVLDRASTRRVADQARRSGRVINYASNAASILDDFASQKKTYVQAQCLDNRRRFERANSPNLSDATVTERALLEFEAYWTDPVARLKVIPGKEALSAFNQHLQDTYGVNITHTAILDAIRPEEISGEMKQVIATISQFACLTVR